METNTKNNNPSISTWTLQAVPNWRERVPFNSPLGFKHHPLEVAGIFWIVLRLFSRVQWTRHLLNLNFSRQKFLPFLLTPIPQIFHFPHAFVTTTGCSHKDTRFALLLCRGKKYLRVISDEKKRKEMKIKYPQNARPIRDEQTWVKHAFKLHEFNARGGELKVQEIYPNGWDPMFEKWFV